MPLGHDFRSLPQSVVYDDGTTFSTGVTTAVYPGPAVLPVIEGKLNEGQLETILQAAETARLVGGEEQRFGDPPVADAATTTITVVVDGEEHVTSVYALRLGGAEPLGLGSEERAARARVRSFVDQVSRLVTEAEQGQYEPKRYRVLPLEPRPEADAPVQPEERQWPIEQVQLAPRQCAAVTGDQAAVLRQVLQDATEITRWRTSSGEIFNLVIRAVLPHEPDCPAATSDRTGGTTP